MTRLGAHPRGALPRALLAALLTGVLAVPASAGSTIVLFNGAGANEGLNDPTGVQPAGGNSGLTLGEARYLAVEYAASVWANALNSDVPVRIRVRFDPLGGTATAGTLGVGGAEAVYRDFAGAPQPGTWYPSALADALAGTDLGPGADDILLTFNSDVDSAAVLGSSRFYYGLDGAAEASDPDLVAVALHELAHGLGFANLLDLETGAKLFGFDDAFSRHLEHHGATPSDFPSMTDSERLAAFSAEPSLHWTGPSAVSAAAGLFSAGVSAEGHIEMYAPDPAGTASLDHFATSLAPDHFMEPFYVGPEARFGLVLGLFRDLGWTTDDACIGISLP